MLGSPIHRTLLALGLVVLTAASAVAATFTGGPYLRLRHEYWKNMSDVNNATDDDRSFYRIKASLWGKLDLSPTFSAYAKLTNESRVYVYFGGGGNAAYNISEAVFDNLYVDVKKAFGAPLDLRIGRQDLIGLYGENFLIVDGTPADGSRTFYFNAVRGVIKTGPASTLDVLAIRDTRYDDTWVINEAKGRTPLNQTDETGFALYHKWDPSKVLHIEDYYFWTNEKGGSTYQLSQETTLSTLGAFAKYAPAELAPLSFRGQFAYQLGTFGSNDRAGYGGYIFTDAAFPKVSLAPQASVGYAALSGDDPATPKNEGWDPLFSRSPWMSEVYWLMFSKESGTAYWTNLGMIRTSVAITPFKNSKFTVWYSILTAPQNVIGTTYGTGKNRGDLWQARADYSFSKQVTAFVLGEYFTPGDFHAGKDPSVFVRTELQIKY